MSDFADDLVARLDAQGIEKVTIFGHSMGGYIALNFAGRFPGRVHGLGLVATRSGPDSAEAAEKRVATAKRVEEEGATFLIDDMAPKMLAKDNQKPEAIAAVKRMMTPASPRGISAALLGMARRPDSTPVLASFTGPALVVTGDADTVIPADESRAMAEKLKHSKLVVIPGAGHHVAFEKPTEFLAAVTDWLARLTG